MKVVIKKAADNNSFVSDEAEKVLIAMCQNCNESKVLAILGGMASNRSAPIKIKLAVCYE
jgi:hypothetical protein